MNRATQLWLMIAGCAALVIAAIVLPAAILRPTARVEPARSIPIGPTSVVKAPPTQTPAVAAAPTQAPAPVANAEGDGLSRGQRFRIVEQEMLKELGPGAALSSALAKAFTFPYARQDAVFGIDISHHNTDNCDCRIDWDLAARQKVAFVYAKATEGSEYRDPTFDGHWRALGQRQKIHRGAYHFMRADVDPEAQAKSFLQKMGKLEVGDLPPALDLEWDIYQSSSRKWSPKDGNDYWSNLSSEEIVSRALKWLDIVERETGRTPIIYTSRTWWNGRIGDDKLERFKRYSIWLSAMEDQDLQLERPGAKGGWAGRWNWKLWQFTNRGDLSNAGLKNPPTPTAERVDVSIFSGTLNQFQQAMGISASIEIAQNNATDSSKADKSDVAPSGTGAQGTSASQQEQPKEQPKEPPKESTDTAKPDDSRVANNPTTGADPAQTVTDGGKVPSGEPKAEPQAAAQAGANSNTAKPNDTANENKVAVSDGTQPAAEPKKDTQVAVLTTPGGGEGSANDPGKKPTGDVVERPMIEIVLVNGRILRIEEDTDPDVLKRLIALLEKQ